MAPVKNLTKTLNNKTEVKTMVKSKSVETKKGVKKIGCKKVKESFELPKITRKIIIDILWNDDLKKFKKMCKKNSFRKCNVWRFNYYASHCS